VIAHIAAVMLRNLVAEMVAWRHAEPDDLRLATRFASRSRASGSRFERVASTPLYAPMGMFAL